MESMDLLRACDEMEGFIKTAQKLIKTWEVNSDNYSQLEEGLTAMKGELDKLPNWMSVRPLCCRGGPVGGSVSPGPLWRLSKAAVLVVYA